MSNFSIAPTSEGASREDIRMGHLDTILQTVADIGRRELVHNKNERGSSEYDRIMASVARLGSFLEDKDLEVVLQGASLATNFTRNESARHNGTSPRGAELVNQEAANDLMRGLVGVVEVALEEGTAANMHNKMVVVDELTQGPDLRMGANLVRKLLVNLRVAAVGDAVVASDAS